MTTRLLRCLENDDADKLASLLDGGVGVDTLMPWTSPEGDTYNISLLELTGCFKPTPYGVIEVLLARGAFWQSLLSDISLLETAVYDNDAQTVMLICKVATEVPSEHALLSALHQAMGAHDNDEIVEHLLRGIESHWPVPDVSDTGNFLGIGSGRFVDLVEARFAHALDAATPAELERAVRWGSSALKERVSARLAPWKRTGGRLVRRGN